MPKSEPWPLSHSSAQTLLGCEQKYYFYKVEGAPHDPDYHKSDALAIGSAVHDILEHSRHEKPESLSKAVEKTIKDPEIQLPKEHANMVVGMVIKYCRLWKKLGLRVLEVEPAIESEEVSGFIDVIEEDQDGKWWITDVKTWKDLKPVKLAEAPSDPQLNLYAAHAPQLAEKFDLPFENFAGVRWRVVTKTSAKQRAKESARDYIKRIADKHLKAYDIAIPKHLLNPPAQLARHLELQKRAKQLKSKRGKKPSRNYGNCFSFFSPCEYWSKCHGGKCYSDQMSEIKVVEEI